MIQEVLTTGECRVCARLQASYTMDAFPCACLNRHITLWETVTNWMFVPAFMCKLECI